LIKYVEVTPKSFLCKGDSNITEFKLSGTNLAGTGAELIDCWDFGPNPQNHCSYSYHMPYGKYSLTVSSEPGMAIAGDPNPWLDSPSFNARPATPDWAGFSPAGDREAIKLGNSRVHQDDGQNVLYMDGHTKFEKNSAAGVDDDNVFTQAGLPSNRKKGNRATVGMEPVDRGDSLLLTDGLK